MSEEYRKTCSRWRIGKPSPMKWKKHTEEARMKMSMANRWKPSPMKWKPSKLLWRKASEETKRRMSEARKWCKASEETKKKLSLAHKWQIPWGKWKKNPKLSWDKCHFRKWWITIWNRKIRTSLENKLRRRSVFERDRFTCQKCHWNWWGINAHHINNFADFPELRFAIDNWITLCSDCHIEFHREYWKSNNTNIQLQQFIW
jgi:hypothetical protein